MLSLSTKETGLQDCFNLGHTANTCLRPSSRLSGSKSQALSHATRLHNRLSLSLEDLTNLCNLVVSEQNQMFLPLQSVRGGGQG